MKAIPVLNLDFYNNSEILTQTDFILMSMTNKAAFSSQAFIDQMTKTASSASILRNAMSAPNTKEKTSTVKAARDGLDHELTVLASMVEAAANDPAVRDDQRVPIVQSAGMDVKSKGGGKSKLQFAVAQGGSSGSVILTAEAGARGHEWRSTPDIEKYENQTPLATTTLSRVEVTGLTVGIKMAFFHRPIIPGKNTDWEGPIIFEIK